MSKSVQTTWECYVCEAQNHIWVDKPNALIPTIKTCHCEGCESKFTLRFFKVRGEHKVGYECVRDFLSAEGKKLYDEKKLRLKNETNKPPVDTAKP